MYMHRVCKVRMRWGAWLVRALIGKRANRRFGLVSGRVKCKTILKGVENEWSCGYINIYICLHII